MRKANNHRFKSVRNTNEREKSADKKKLKVEKATTGTSHNSIQERSDNSISKSQLEINVPDDFADCNITFESDDSLFEYEKWLCTLPADTNIEPIIESSSLLPNHDLSNIIEQIRVSLCNIDSYTDTLTESSTISLQQNTKENDDIEVEIL